MVTDSKKDIIKKIRERKYLNKDFDSLKADLLDYAKTYFPEANQDFSEVGFGGLMLDLAAYIGDNNSFYLDHQFHETNPETAVELRNVERHLINAGVPIVGSAPAVVTCTFLIEVPATSTPPEPDVLALPVVGEGTVVKADNGTEFELTEDIDFAEVDRNGNLKATIVIGNRNSSNIPTSFILSLDGICISGFRASESFSVGNFSPFLRFTLSQENVTEVIRILDSVGNEYFEVGHLTQDTVFKATLNRNSDNELVKENVMPVPAPYRFTKNTSLTTRLTSLTFGGGSADTLNDDSIPDPSEFAVPLFGKRNFSRFTLNPGNLLRSNTLGTVTPNSTLTVTYRYGGGLNNNVIRKSIRDATKLFIRFPNDPTQPVATSVKNSLDVVNKFDAAGGEDPPTVNELKERIPAVRASQGRIVTKEDLIARVYTMPSSFGRVFRASVHPNPNNPLATRLFVISRNTSNQLVVSPDTLKKNLVNYLNEFRLISDAIDILDAQVINFKVEFAMIVDPQFNRNIILQNVLRRLQDYFSIRNFDIDQPIIIADVQNIIYNNDGVLTVDSVSIKNQFGTVGSNRAYSDIQFDVEANTTRGIVFGPAGSIFELRFPEFDITGITI